MKNIQNTSKWLMFVGMLGTGFISCQKTINDFVPIKAEQNNEVKETESSKFFKRSGGTGTTYSETYQLLSFTGTKSQGNAYSNIFVDFTWSAVGEKDVTSYEIEVSYGGLYIPQGVITLTNPTDSLTYHSQRRGFSWPGKTANCIARLKITLIDNSVIYSNNYSFSFKGKGAF